ncbi:uncharacterized protein LOC106027889 [Cavia porcellus]|uniref:uncharacterized protein LOC106027889 n=1 Tax=Cavia porcellus TaxID=10141 RepID=UPI002FE0D095
MLPLRTVISQISRFGGSTWKEPTPQLTGAVLHEVINGQTHLAKGGAPLRQALVPICHFGSRAGSQGQEHLLAREHELSSCPLGARGLLWSAGCSPPVDVPLASSPQPSCTPLLLPSNMTGPLCAITEKTRTDGKKSQKDEECLLMSEKISHKCALPGGEKKECLKGSRGWQKLDSHCQLRKEAAKGNGKKADTPIGKLVSFQAVWNTRLQKEARIEKSQEPQQESEEKWEHRDSTYVRACCTPLTCLPHCTKSQRFPASTKFPGEKGSTRRQHTDHCNDYICISLVASAQLRAHFPPEAVHQRTRPSHHWISGSTRGRTWRLRAGEPFRWCCICGEESSLLQQDYMNQQKRQRPQSPHNCRCTWSCSPDCFQTEDREVSALREHGKGFSSQKWVGISCRICQGIFIIIILF